MEETQRSGKIILICYGDIHAMSLSEEKKITDHMTNCMIMTKILLSLNTEIL